MNKYTYRNKLAVVTGASSGIGKAYANELAAQGCHVVLAARSKDKLDSMAREINRQYGVQAYALACDLSKANAPRQLPNKFLNWACPWIFSSQRRRRHLRPFRGNIPGARAEGDYAEHGCVSRSYAPVAA